MKLRIQIPSWYTDLIGEERIATSMAWMDTNPESDLLDYYSTLGEQEFREILRHVNDPNIDYAASFLRQAIAVREYSMIKEGVEDVVYMGIGKTALGLLCIGGTVDLSADPPKSELPEGMGIVGPKWITSLITEEEVRSSIKQMIRDSGRWGVHMYQIIPDHLKSHWIGFQSFAHCINNPVADSIATTFTTVLALGHVISDLVI